MISIHQEKAKKINKIFYYDGNFCSNDIANILTGFGERGSCTLCLSSAEDKYEDKICENCIYQLTDNGFCNLGEAKETFMDIRYAENSEKLLLAFKNRANFLSKLIDITVS